jgi:hypothetical protein
MSGESNLSTTIFAPAFSTLHIGLMPDRRPWVMTPNSSPFSRNFVDTFGGAGAGDRSLAFRVYNYLHLQALSQEDFQSRFMAHLSFDMYTILFASLRFAPVVLVTSIVQNAFLLGCNRRHWCGSLPKIIEGGSPSASGYSHLRTCRDRPCLRSCINLHMKDSKD